MGDGRRAGLEETTHRVIFGDSRCMEELNDESVQLIVTSPPYFNAPFDYKGRFENYEEFLRLITDFARESFRTIAPGRIACVNCDDMLVDGEKYPVVADVTSIFLSAGFRYRDKFIWRKPEGYIRISRRSGVLLQHPYPMYFYPDNLQESILVFQKGRFDYSSIPESVRQASRVDLEAFQANRWFLTVWDMVNRLPSQGGEGYPAAFPEELPRRLITLYSYKGETVLDPFLGSGTTSKVAFELGRSSVGYEIDDSLKETIREKISSASATQGKAPRIDFVPRAPLKRRT